MLPSDAGRLPLRRLLKRREAARLLEQYAALTPTYTLAVLDAEGRLFAASSESQTLPPAERLLQAVRVGSQTLAYLTAWPSDELPDEQAAVQTSRLLRALGHSLQLLLVKALETRDVVDETVERYREINLLYHVGETIGACLDPAEIPGLVLREATRIIQADVGMVLLPPSLGDESPMQALAIKAAFGFPGAAESLQQAMIDLIEQVMTSGRPAIVTRFGQAMPVGAEMGSVLCVPMHTQDRVTGLILFGRTIDRTVFTAGEQKLLLALAGQAAIAIETIRLHLAEISRQRLEEELAIGRQIQLSLLPAGCPEIDGWDFAAGYQAAREVSGDLYDFFELPDQPNRLGLVIADVTGKGVPAALFMAVSRTVIRTESRSGLDPAAILIQTNQAIIRDIRSRLFLTACYAILDTDSGRLRYARAGHDRPLWLRADSNQVRQLPGRGMLLGAFSRIRVEEQEIELAPGDCLVFYTDGVTEARNEVGEIFGEERLMAVVQTGGAAGAQQILERILTAVHEFSGRLPQADDITLFVIKRQQAARNL